MMQFLKKHYEKILLAVIALAALVAVACLPILVSNDKQKLDDLENTILTKKTAPLAGPDLNQAQALLKKAGSPVALDLDSGHKVFNPVRWSVAADGHVFPDDPRERVYKLQVLKMSPLYMVLSLENVSAVPGIETHYCLGVRHEAAATPSLRSMKLTCVPVNYSTNNFIIVSVEGSDDNPTLHVKLIDSGESVSITKNSPYKRVEGYTADLYYPPEKRTFPPNRRKGDAISFAGEIYNIMDIRTNEVVLSQQSNQKTWHVPNNPSSSSAPNP
jgi:hypothetical protein